MTLIVGYMITAGRSWIRCGIDAAPVFIHLLHGRDDPKQDMCERGFVGPILGPFEAIHFTYKEPIRCIADGKVLTWFRTIFSGA